MRVVVTGSAGLIGSLLVERLRARGDEPVALDLREAAPRSILDPAALAAAMEGADGVVHLAAVSRVAWGESHPELCALLNVEGTRRVVAAAAAARSRPWLVHASSREVYGDARTVPVHEDAPARPVNHYGRTKLRSEAVVGAAAGTGLATAILRLSSVYGGRRDHPDRAVPALTWRALQGSPLVVTGAETYFDFVHVEDTVAGLIAAADLLAAERRTIAPVNLATGVATTLRGLAETVLAVTGSRSDLVAAPPRAFDVSGYCGSTDRASSLLGWRAERDLARGVGDVADLLRRFGPLAPVAVPDPAMADA